MFKIEIETDNAAFEDEYACKAEIKRLLEQVAQRLLSDANEGWLFDINGNRVGRYELAYEKPEDDEETED